MQFRNRLWFGGVAGAGLGAAFGDKDRDLTDRATDGMLAGLALGAVTPPWMLRDAAKVAGLGPLAAGQKYAGRMWGHYNELRDAGLPVWKSGMGAFGRLPVLMGAGALAGAMLDDKDPKRGALIGAGAGAAARLAFVGVPAWKEMTAPVLVKHVPGVRKVLPAAWQNKMVLSKRLPVAMGLSALAYGVASHYSAQRVTAEAVSDPVDGYTEYAPGTAPGRGVKDRLNMMQATGDIVFGAHAGRH